MIFHYVLFILLSSQIIGITTMDLNKPNKPEAIMSDNDMRQPIFKMNGEINPFAKCIGRLVASYCFTDPLDDNKTYTYTSTSTATIIESHFINPSSGVTFLMSCAHSIILFIYRCACCTQYTFDPQEHECRSPHFPCRPTAVQANKIWFESTVMQTGSNGIECGDTLATYPCETNPFFFWMEHDYYSYPDVCSSYDYVIITAKSSQMAIDYINMPKIDLDSTKQTIGQYKTGWYILGYPDDKTNTHGQTVLCGMSAGKGGECSIQKWNGKPYLQQTKVDTFSGQSGAALFIILNGSVVIFGVHTGTTNNGTVNVANILDSHKISKMNVFMKQITASEQNKSVWISPSLISPIPPPLYNITFDTSLFTAPRSLPGTGQQYQNNLFQSGGSPHVIVPNQTNFSPMKPNVTDSGFSRTTPIANLTPVRHTYFGQQNQNNKRMNVQSPQTNYNINTLKSPSTNYNINTLETPTISTFIPTTNLNTHNISPFLGLQQPWQNYYMNAQTPKYAQQQFHVQNLIPNDANRNFMPNNVIMEHSGVAGRQTIHQLPSNSIGLNYCPSSYPERPYQCDVCHKKFSLKSNLKVHRRTHSGIKPFVCNFCGKKYTSKQNLDNHTKKHHLSVLNIL